MGLSNSRGLVGISFSNHLNCLSISFFSNLSFNQICLCNNFTVFKFSISFNRIDFGSSFSSPFVLNSLNLRLDCFYLLILLKLRLFGILILIFTLFFMNLSSLCLFFLIVFNSLVIGKSLSLKCVLELVNRLLLHRCSSLFSKFD